MGAPTTAGCPSFQVAESVQTGEREKWLTGRPGQRLRNCLMLPVRHRASRGTPRVDECNDSINTSGNTATDDHPGVGPLTALAYELVIGTPEIAVEIEEMAGADRVPGSTLCVFIESVASWNGIPMRLWRSSDPHGPTREIRKSQDC